MSMISEFKEFAVKGSLIDMAVGVNFEDLSIKIGDAAIGYGAFIQATIDFIIIAFVIFMILKAINKMKAAAEEEKAAEPEEDPADVALLSEIRDLLKQR